MHDGKSGVGRERLGGLYLVGVRSWHNCAISVEKGKASMNRATAVMRSLWRRGRGGEGALKDGVQKIEVRATFFAILRFGLTAI